MSFANVNIGSGTSTGDGDSLRSAFNKINQNFANIADSRFDITIDAPVQSVNNQTGNVLLTVSDIAGATTPGYVDAKAEYAIATSRGYTDLSISNLLDSAPGALNTLNELAAAMGDDPNFAATVTNRLAAIETDLDTVRSESSGLLAQEITQLSNDLDDETARAISSEQALQSNINLISTTLSATEQTLQDNIDAETASRQNADAALQNNIDAETQARIVADDALSARIDSVLANIDPAALDSFAEVVTAFQDADSNLNDAITALADTASTGLQDEIDRATAAEQTLQDNIDAESAARQTRDSELESGIDTVTADLVTEQTARTNADTALQDNIDAEAASRAAADAALQANIDALSTTLTDYVDTEIAAIPATDLTGLATETFVTDAIAAIPATDLTGLATETYVDTAVSNLVNGAGPALDTLNELAAALGDDANFSTTISTQLGLKANTTDLATVATTGSYNDLTNKPNLIDSILLSTTLPSGNGSFNINRVGSTVELQYVPADVPTDISDLTDTEGLLTSIDPIKVDNWDTAYGWGDHSAAGYVKTVNGNTPDSNGDAVITGDNIVTALQYRPVSSVNSVVPNPATGALTLDLADFTDTTNLIPTVPTVVSAFTNDAGYLTAGDIAVNTGNFTFAENTLSVGNANGITIDASGSGEIVMSDNVGIKQTNPGLALHIGSVNDAAPNEIGIAITAGNDTINGTASLQWDWHDGVGAGSNSTDTSQHAKFGIFKNGTLNHPWLTFDRLAPADALAVDATGKLLVSGNEVALKSDIPTDINQLNDSSGLLAGRGGGGTSLPADAPGYLNNDGTGTLSWVTGNPASSGVLPYSDVVVFSNTTVSDWTEYTLSGTMDTMYDFGDSIPTVTLVSEVVYGARAGSNTKVLYINDAAINNNTTGIVVEFPADPAVGDVFSVPIITELIDVNAGSFIAGETYTIKTLGDTDWSSIGASFGGPGQTFVATGAGSGTGIATILAGVKKIIFKPAAGQRGRTMAIGPTGSTIFGVGGEYDFMYVDLTGQESSNPVTWVYGGIIGGVPTWYQLLF